MWLSGRVLVRHKEALGLIPRTAKLKETKNITLGSIPKELESCSQVGPGICTSRNLPKLV